MLASFVHPFASAFGTIIGGAHAGRRATDEVGADPEQRPEIVR
ncbi:Hypothetical protein A7982_10686 [Minicystis rosea]|nr:Hypothetical protein A7982_10686 [Minicystis rosea]